MSSWFPRLGKRRQEDRDLSDLRHQLELAKALSEERERIRDDLHDDVGSQLLTLLHRVGPEEQQLVRQILQDLRAILSREHSSAGTLLEILAHIREESELRLQTRNIPLDWQQEATLPDPALNAAQGMHLSRIVRESVTNALRHARPARLRVNVGEAGPWLVFEITDDGHFEPARIGQGRGTRSMQTRAGELHGDIAWQAGTLGGTKVCLRFPLPATDSPVSTGYPPNGARGRIMS